MYALIWIQCKWTHAYAQRSLHLKVQYILAVFQYFQVYSYRSKVRGDGSVRCTTDNVAGAPFSSSQLQHIHITQLRMQINKHRHTNASIHIHSMSWPLLGPHVVGVFSYGAGNGSQESERCSRPADKRQSGPGSRAKEAPGSAPGPPGPWGAPLNSQVFLTGGTLCKHCSNWCNGLTTRNAWSCF